MNISSTSPSSSQVPQDLGINRGTTGAADQPNTQEHAEQTSTTAAPSDILRKLQPDPSIAFQLTHKRPQRLGLGASAPGAAGATPQGGAPNNAPPAAALAGMTAAGSLPGLARGAVSLGAAGLPNLGSGLASWSWAAKLPVVGAYARLTNVMGLATLLTGDTDKYTNRAYLASSFAMNTDLYERLGNASTEQLRDWGINTQQDFLAAREKAYDELNSVNDAASKIASASRGYAPIMHSVGSAEFVAAGLDSGERMTIYPADASGNKPSILVYPPGSSQPSDNVIVTPIIEGENMTTTFPALPQKGWGEFILHTPADSGLPPMHVMYSKATGGSPCCTIIKPEGPSSRAGQGYEGKDMLTLAQREANSLKTGHFTEADLPRLRELAADPARGLDRTTWGEAEVGLGLEKRGAVPRLTRSSDKESEFIDASGQKWDVKAFRDHSFKISEVMESVTGEIRNGNNLMLDTRYLTPAQLGELKQAIGQAGYTGKTLWWP